MTATPARYYAQVNDDGLVVQVIVAPSMAWVNANLDGTWKRTTSDLSDEQYPGPGWSYDPVAKSFAPPPLVVDEG